MLKPTEPYKEVEEIETKEVVQTLIEDITPPPEV